MTNTVYHWLKGSSGLEALKQEMLDAVPGAAGLFCKGRKELSRTADILGGIRVRQKLTFALCLHSTSREVPDFFLRLDTKNAPVLGEDQTVTVTEGKLTKDDGTGICRYEATITFIFTSEG